MVLILIEYLFIFYIKLKRRRFLKYVVYLTTYRSMVKRYFFPHLESSVRVKLQDTDTSISIVI